MPWPRRTPTACTPAVWPRTFPLSTLPEAAVRAASATRYTGSYGQGINCPIFDVSWGDAARFCNWLQNGQPTGSEGNGTTETGAYTLDGATTDAALMATSRNAGATYFIPSQDEWYKAAFYKGGGTNAGYWFYTTQSNTPPSNTLSATGTNNGNCDINGETDPVNKLTPVSAFAASPGPYGTFDMGGDVQQWNEFVLDIDIRQFRGGSWASLVFNLGSGVWDEGEPPTWCSTTVGFRVASVALPGDANLDGKVDINDLSILLATATRAPA